jgi:integrase
VRDRGEGYLFQPTYTARDGTRKKTATWWLRISVHGKKVPIPTGTTDEKEARAFARKKAVELAEGQLGGLTSSKVTFNALEQAVLVDYRNNSRTSTRHVVLNFKHLREHLGHLRAQQIDEGVIEAYKDKRLDAGAAPATVNLELASLQRGMNLCKRRLPRVPEFTYLVVKNARQGFFERADFDLVLSQLPLARGKRRDIGSALEVAYITGWRLASEILTRQWRHVDFVGGWLRLEPHEAKNEEGRMFPLIPGLRAILEGRRAWTDDVERRRGIVIPWVFHRWGKPITSLQKTWEKARAAAGQPHRLVHDFRRTAVRNLERAGIPRSAAMKMVGHKTEAMYRRYAIVEESVLLDAGEKLAALHQVQREASAKVMSIKR